MKLKINLLSSGKRTACFLTFLALLGASTGLCAQDLQTSTAVQAPSADPHLAVAGAKRPASVPEGYVITPFGYLHPSCVHGLAKGEQLLEDGRLKHADGQVDNQAPTCSYTRYTPNGRAVLSQGGVSNQVNSNQLENNVASQQAMSGKLATSHTPTINGWIEYSSVTTNSSYGKLNGTWTVPTPPAVSEGQVIYFFTGLEDLHNIKSILQPVLQWTPNQWAIASWNCCIAGQAYHSNIVNVNSGDTIFGSMVSTCGAGTLSCGTWNVVTTDQTLNQSTTLTSNVAGQTFNWGFGGVLEVYGVNQCGDLPANGNLSFNSLGLYDSNLNQITPSWNVASPSSTISPKCDYNVSGSSTQVNIGYQNIPPATNIGGSHVLVPQNATGLALDDLHSQTAPGSLIDIWGINGTSAQSWNLSTANVVPGGFYNIAVSYGPYCLTGSTDEGTQAQLQPCNGSLAQAWEAIPSGAGYTLSPAINTSLCLDVQSSGTSWGTAVQVWACDNTSAQQWAVR